MPIAGAACQDEDFVSRRCPAASLGMLEASRATGLPSAMRNILIGVLASVVVTVLIAWRFGANAKEVFNGAGTGPLLLFVLGSWLLYSDFGHSGRAKSILNTLGIAFTILRTISFVRMSLLKELPSKFEPVFNSKHGTSWTGWGLYASASLFQQVLLHRVLPEWACTVVGLLHSCGFVNVCYRFQRMGSDYVPFSSILRAAMLSQVGMFVPYHLFSSRWLRQHISPVSRQHMDSHKAQGSLKSSGSKDCALAHTAGGLHGDAALEAAPCKMDKPLMAEGKQACVSSVEGRTQHAELCSTMRDGSAFEQAPTEAAAPPQSIARAASNVTQASASKATGVAAAVRALQKAPYQSRLRMHHSVCVKLDTQLPCSSLPAGLMEQLQGALQTSIGTATSLSISNVAVRPGCICIVMGIEEQLDQSSGEQGCCEQSQLRVEDLAHALLPQLQGILSTGQSTAAIQYSTVQLDSRRARCVWKAGLQAWEVQVDPAPAAAPAHRRQPCLGIAVATGVRSPAAVPSDQPATAPRPLHVLAEVQLWGVSIVADVDGWTPPQQHQDSEGQWPGSQQLAGSKPTMKLLARARGGYLPTQVLRLMPGRSDGYVTAQVVIQLHEHQLIRHHDGGAASSLLLMDLELWQNEVLLSSCPLLSLPASAATANDVPKTSDWWWGAADSTVSVAIAQLEECAQQLLLAAAQPNAPAATQTYTRYQQDLALWLQQVQYVAYSSKVCQSAPANSHVKHHQSHTVAVLQQPTLAPSMLTQLGCDLMQYASHVGWQHVHQMVSQQQRIVAALGAGSFPNLCHSHGTLARCMHAAKAVLLGHACHLDEQMYKQQLRAHVTGVLMVSSTANTLIGSVMVVRAKAYGGLLFTCLPLSWTSLHAAAMCAMLLSHTKLHIPAPEYALKITAGAYVWKAVGHLATALFITPAYKQLYSQAFQRQQLWIVMKLVTLLSSQVPASVLLPAPVVTCMAVLLEFPALLLDVMRSSGWHPITCVVTTFMLAVGARFVLDAQFRLQLTRPLAATSPVRKIVKVN